MYLCRKVVVAIFILASVAGCNKRDSQWIEGWKDAQSLNVARAGAASVTENGYIYVIGGVDGRNFLRSTEFAKINEDGSLGVWQPGSAMNEERGFTDAIVKNGYIYVVGGGNGQYGEHLLRSSERAQILPDGSLGPWQNMSDMVVPRRCSKILVSGEYIYTFGGFGGALLDTVEHSLFTAENTLGEWTLEKNTMTIPRYVNSVKKVGEYAYVLGGHDQTKGVGINNVEMARFTSDGGMAAWQITEPLRTGRYGLATASANGYLYAIGGITGSEYLSSIEKTKIGADGGLSAWQATTAMMEPRSNLSVVTYQDMIYIIGGTNRDQYLTSVRYASVDKNGGIGFFGGKIESEAVQKEREALKAAVSQLPNSGEVVSIIQASAYSYIQVRTEDSLSWIAAPKQELQAGEKIHFSKGVYMSNFYSKELGRSFPSVLFVSQVAKE